MGFVKVKVTLRNSEEPDRKGELEMIVDTGAIYSLVPRHILENIGIRSLERRVFTLANGERIERGFGGAIFEVEEIEVEERRGHAPVIFGEKEDKCSLGVTALEALGLEVDVVTGKLKPMELLLL